MRTSVFRVHYCLQRLKALATLAFALGHPARFAHGCAVRANRGASRLAPLAGTQSQSERGLHPRESLALSIRQEQITPPAETMAADQPAPGGLKGRGALAFTCSLGSLYRERSERYAGERTRACRGLSEVVEDQKNPKASF